ncbi:MAG: winged helix DNA-binding protein [Bacteroidetes bacterium]|nr:winged helix DNA-binding protein [Fibrella sp.]
MDHPDAGRRAEPADIGADARPMPDAEMAPSLLAQYISMTYRYVRHYVRKALAATPLITFDDFICLVILLETGSLTKMELIEATINEKPSGLLVIKRLLDAGFVQQVTDQTDRRSKRISLTPARRSRGGAGRYAGHGPGRPVGGRCVQPHRTDAVFTVPDAVRSVP